jgi:hypothetical protein
MYNRFIKYTLRTIALLFMLPLAVMGILWLIVSLPFTQRYILDYAEKQVEHVLAGDCSIQSFTTNFISTARVDNIVLRDSSGHGDSIFIHSVRAHFSLLPFFKKQIYIKKARVSRLDAFLTVAPTGKLMIPALPDSMFLQSLKQNKYRKKKRNQSGRWQLYIGSARVNNLNATYSDSVHAFVGTIRNTVASAEIHRIDSMNLHLEVRGGSYESPWWTGEIDTIGASGVLTLKGMTVDDAFIDGSSTRITGKGKIPFKSKGNWHFSAEVTTDVKPVKAIYGYIPSILTDKGRVHAVASWDGTLKRPVLKFQAAGSDWKSSYFDIPTLYADGSYDGDSLLAFGLTAITDMGRVSCSGHVHTERLFSRPEFKEYRAALDVEDIRLKEIKLPENINRYKLWENGDAVVKVNGCDFRDLPDTIDAGLVLKNTPDGPDALSLNGSLIHKNWNLGVIFGNNRMSAQGKLINTTHLNGNGNIIVDNLTPVSTIISKEAVNGSLSADIKIQGKIANPDFALFIKSDSLSWRTVSGSSVAIALKKRGNDYYFDSSSVTIHAGLDSIAPFLNVADFGGNLNGDLLFTGNLKSPAVKASLSVYDPVYSLYSADSVRATFYIDRFDSIYINTLQLFKGTTGLKSHGEVLLNRKHVDINIKTQYRRNNTWRDSGTIDIAGGLQGDSISLITIGKSIDLSLLNGLIPGNDSLQGTIDITADIGSSLNNPDGSLQLSIQHPSYNKMEFKSINAHFGLADSLITGDAVLLLNHRKSDSIQGSISMPLTRKNNWTVEASPSRPLKIDLKAEEIDLGSLVASVLDSTWDAVGTVNSVVEIRDRGKGLRINGKVNADAGHVKNNKEKISAENIHATASIRGRLNSPDVNYYFTTKRIAFHNGIIDSTFFIGDVTADSINCESARVSLPHGGLLSLSGVFPIDKADSLLLNPGLRIDFVVVKFPMRLIADIFPENMIKKGVAHGKGTIGIGHGRPLFNGYLNVDTMVIAPEGILPEIGPLSIAIDLRNDSVLVQKCNGKWGRGRINGNGHLVWDYNGLENCVLNFKGNNTDVEVIDILEADIPEFNLSFLKQNQRFLLKGSVDIGAARFYRDIKIADFIQDQSTAQYKKEQTDSLLKSIGLQVKVNLLEDMIVDMNLGYFEIGTDITITGDLQDPSFIGEATITTGEVVYLDRRFEVTEGTFRNYEPGELNPVLNLKAQTEVFGIEGSGGRENTRTYTIYMELSGTMNKPVLRFSEEDGMMSEGDIISILTFGQPLGSVGGDLGERLRAFAGQSVLGFGTRKLEQVLRLDRIDIQGDIFKLGQNDNESKNTPTLTLSKRISPRLLLTYEAVLGDLTRRRVSALYRLTRRFFIKGNADNDDYGLDFIFKYSK